MSNPKRVLVVDDAELARVTLHRLLGRAGYEVRVAGSVEEARRAMAEWSPDCVVIDQRLPDGDGLLLAAALRDQRGRRGPRVVVMSGDPLPSDAVVDVDAFLLKPAGARAVLAAIAGPEAT